MNKKIFLGIFLIITVIIFSNIVGVFAATKAELQNEQANVNEQIKATEEEIDIVKGELSETMKQIQTLNAQISSYQSELDSLDGQISNLEKSISESEEKLAEAEKKYIAQEEGFKNRIVAQYEAGELTYLDVILGSGSIWDMVSNWYIVSEIAELDEELLKQIEKNKNEIQAAKESLETSKTQVEAARKSKEEKQEALKNSQSVKEQYANELSEDEKALKDKLDELEKENAEIARQLQAMETKYSEEIANLGGTGTFQRPVNSGVITCTMYYSSGKYHGALDYGVPVGTKVYAAADGVVLAAGWSGSGYGYYVCLQHSGGLRTYYAHSCGTLYVSVGQTVSKGQLIMLSGNTGNSTGPHLHFEVRVWPYNWSSNGNDSRRDPRNYL